MPQQRRRSGLPGCRVAQGAGRQQDAGGAPRGDDAHLRLLLAGRQPWRLLLLLRALPPLLQRHSQALCERGHRRTLEGPAAAWVVLAQQRCLRGVHAARAQQACHLVSSRLTGKERAREALRGHCFTILPPW
jgi:hypothetical protein